MRQSVSATASIQHIYAATLGANPHIAVAVFAQSVHALVGKTHRHTGQPAVGREIHHSAAYGIGNGYIAVVHACPYPSAAVFHHRAHVGIAHRGRKLEAIIVKINKRKIVIARKPKVVLRVLLIFQDVAYGQTVAVFGIKIVRNETSAGFIIIRKYSFF